MNLTHETSFVVMPEDCNYMKGPTGLPMVHGGALLGYMDRAAAVCMSRLLHDSECESAITAKGGDLIFHAAAESGDIIYIQSEVIELRTRAAKIQVKCYREKHGDPKRDLVAEMWFVFLSRKSVPSYSDGSRAILYPHGLSMPDKGPPLSHMIVEPKSTVTDKTEKPDWRRNIDIAKIATDLAKTDDHNHGQAVS